MKFHLSIAAFLLLGLSSLTGAEDEYTVSFSNTLIEHVLDFYSTIDSNTAVILPAEISTMWKTVTIQTAKPLDLASTKRLIENELERQANIKIRHMILAEAAGLGTFQLAKMNAVLAITLPPLPDSTLMNTNKIVPSVSFKRALLKDVKKYYETVSGAVVVYEGNLSRLNEKSILTLIVPSPVTKDTALKLLNLSLILQNEILALPEEGGEIVWLRNRRELSPTAPRILNNPN